MHKIKHLIATLALLFVATMPVTASAMPLTQFGAAPCKATPVLTFSPWYKGLECTNGKRPDGTSYQQPEITKLNDIWIIALNIVEWLIGAAAYAALGFIVWGGFKYIKSRGDPGQTVEAKMTIIYAVAGLAIALASTAIVVFVQGLFK